jgi:hypothetical protein
VPNPNISALAFPAFCFAVFFPGLWRRKHEFLQFAYTDTDSAELEILPVVNNLNNGDDSVVVIVANHAVHSPNDNNGPGAPRTISIDLSALGTFHVGQPADDRCQHQRDLRAGRFLRHAESTDDGCSQRLRRGTAGAELRRTRALIHDRTSFARHRK